MIWLIAGPIAAGKTAVAEQLTAMTGGEVIRVRHALADVLGIQPDDRLELQRRGADLDRRTTGRWLSDYIDERGAGQSNLIIDSLRTRLQTLPVLDAFVDSRLIYLDAHDETRRARYAAAGSKDRVKSSVPYDTAMRHPTEIGVRELVPLAHLVVQTDDLAAPDIARLVIDIP